MQISNEDLSRRADDLTIIWHRCLFSLIWKRIKKQYIYVDVNKYQFEYEYRKMYIFRWNIYVLIATHGMKRFIVPEPFKESKEYQVLFLNFS